MFENFNDGYHANKLHPHDPGLLPERAGGLPGRVGPDVERHLPHERLHAHRRGLQRHDEGVDAGLPAAHRGGAVALDVRTAAAVVVLRDAPDQAFFFIVRPTSADTIDLEIGYLFHPSALEHPMFDHLLQMSRCRRPGLRAPGPGRHDQGAARHAQPVRGAGSLLVAGSQPRLLQPVACSATNSTGPITPSKPSRGRYDPSEHADLRRLPVG